MQTKITTTLYFGNWEHERINVLPRDLDVCIFGETQHTGFTLFIQHDHRYDVDWVDTMNTVYFYSTDKHSINNASISLVLTKEQYKQLKRDFYTALHVIESVGVA